MRARYHAGARIVVCACRVGGKRLIIESEQHRRWNAGISLRYLMPYLSPHSPDERANVAAPACRFRYNGSMFWLIDQSLHDEPGG
jgi:hypothetical protein